MGASLVLVVAQNKSRTAIPQMIEPVQGVGHITIEMTRDAMERGMHAQPHGNDCVVIKLIRKMIIEILAAEAKETLNPAGIEHGAEAPVGHSRSAQPERFQAVTKFLSAATRAKVDSR